METPIYNVQIVGCIAKDKCVATWLCMSASAPTHNLQSVDAQKCTAIDELYGIANVLLAFISKSHKRQIQIGTTILEPLKTVSSSMGF